LGRSALNMKCASCFSLKLLTVTCFAPINT
jgi:hypothetical protein